MTDLNFQKFDWDHGNANKNFKKHGISQRQIEALFATQPFVTEDARHSGPEERFIAAGINDDGRWILVSFTFRILGEERHLRPISARYMHVKEIRRYEKKE